MPHQFSETAPGGTVSGRKTVRRQSRGFVLEYDLESSAEEPVSVRLTDGVPAGRPEEFGFHREHEPAEWTLADGELRMTVALDPGEERTVVLGLVTDGGDLPDPPAEPTVDVRAADAAPDDGDTGGFFEGGAPEVDADGGLMDADRGDARGGDAGDVVSSVVEELEAGRVSESDLATLREHLGTGRPESEAARLEYVQKRLGDFDAYVDALEDLLSVHGSGEDAVTELQGRLEAVADDVEAIRRRQDELADRLDDLAAAQESTAETVDSLRDAHADDVAAVRSDLEALEAEVEAFESIRRALVDGFRGSADADGDSTSGTTLPEERREADFDADPGADPAEEAETGDGSAAGGTGVSVEPAVDEPDRDDEAVEINPGATDGPSDAGRADEGGADVPTASHFTVSSTATEGDGDGSDASVGGRAEDPGGTDLPADDGDADDPVDVDQAEDDLTTVDQAEDDPTDGDSTGADRVDDGFLAPDEIEGLDGDDGTGDDTDADGGWGTDATDAEDAVDDDGPGTGTPDDDAAVEGGQGPSDDPDAGDDSDAGDEPDDASQDVAVADAETKVATDAAVVPFGGDDAADGEAAADDEPADDGEQGEDDDGGGGWTSSIF